jgi:hypothetical protein
MKKVTTALLTVLMVCVGVRIGAALVAPILPALIVFVFLAGLLLWLVGRR